MIKILAAAELRVLTLATKLRMRWKKSCQTVVADDVRCDARVIVKDVNEDLISGYDIFTPIAATDLGFDPGIPVVEAGPNFIQLFNDGA